MNKALSISTESAALASGTVRLPVFERFTWLLPLAATLLPTMLLGGGAWMAWQDVWNDAQRSLVRGADAAAAYSARALDSYVVAAGRVNDALRGLTDGEITAREAELHALLARLVLDLPQAEAAYVVDRQGYALVGASVFPVPRATAPAADRDFFLALSGPSPPPLHISQVYVSRFDGKLFFAVSRARTGTGNGLPEGRFDGLVNLSVFPDQLAEDLRRSLDEDTDAIALIREDGQFLARTDGMAQPLPPLPAGSFFRDTAQAGTAAGVTTNAIGPRGERRLAAMRRVEGFPVYAAASRPREAIVARWYRRFARYLAFGVPATLALLFLSLRVRQTQAQLLTANAALGTALSRSNDRLARAQAAGGVHPFEVGADGICQCDDGLRALFGLPPGATLDYPAFLRALPPEDRERVAARHRAATSRSGPFELEFRVLAADAGSRWLLTRGEAQLGAGHTRLLFGICLDITALKQAEAALSESETRLRIAQEAGGIGSWEWDVGSGRLRWTIQTFALFGFDPALGEPHHDQVRARRHPEDRLRLDIELAAAVKSGRIDTEYRILRPRPDGGTDTVWIATQGRSMPGRGKALFGVHRDITQRKTAEEHMALLAREVEHRSKNTLAVVQATLRLTRAGNHEEYLRVVGGRIAALARAHSLFAERGLVGAELRSLLEGELLPYTPRGDAAGPLVALAGPALTLSVAATQPLAMVIHELATNAAKHGALAVPDGRLSVAWTTADGELRLHWTESGVVLGDTPPTHTGFGTRVIEQTVRRQLGGELHRSWTPDGLLVAMRFPILPATPAPEHGPA